MFVEKSTTCSKWKGAWVSAAGCEAVALRRCELIFLIRPGLGPGFSI
jgi:hypothetical protein